MTPHFSLKELTSSPTARRLNFLEQFSPPKAVIENLKILAETLESVRVLTGPIIVTSGYRCSRLNTHLGSVSNAHPKGYAADLVLPSRKNRNLVTSLAKLSNDPLFRYDQIILEYGIPSSPSWVHISVDPRARRQWLSYAGGSHVPVNYRSFL